MKIGIDARYGLRKVRRGIGNYIYQLLCEYRKLKVPHYQFFLYADQSADPEVIESMRSDLFTIEKIYAPNLALWEQVALPLAAKSDKVDVLHCTSNMAPVILKPCPIVTTIHDVIEFRRKEFGDTKLPIRHRISRLYRMGVLPRVAKISDMIITDTTYSKNDISEVLSIPKYKVAVIGLAINDNNFKISDSEQISILKRLQIKEKYIFALGAIDKRKNTAMLLQSYYEYRSKTNNNVELVIAGIERSDMFDGSISEGVRLFGYLPNNEILALYHNATLFIYPSLYEGFGLPVLEAMACGTPVLSSATTSVGEVAADAAITFDPKNTLELSDKIILLLENPALRQTLINKGYKRVLEFSWERCARETLDVYRSISGMKQ
jgi:glycosyltransferase involved in cell wall biosynthesis